MKSRRIAAIAAEADGCLRRANATLTGTWYARVTRVQCVRELESVPSGRNRHEALAGRWSRRGAALPLLVRVRSVHYRSGMDEEIAMIDRVLSYDSVIH